MAMRKSWTPNFGAVIWEGWDVEAGSIVPTIILPPVRRFDKPSLLRSPADF